MNPSTEVGLDAVDRAVKHAATASAAWRKAVKDDPLATAGPLGSHRSVAGQQSLEALGRREVVSQDAELRDALCFWIRVLTVRRVTEAFEAAEAVAELEPTAQVRLDTVRLVSFREAWRGLVSAREVVAGEAWLDAARQRGPAIAAVRRELYARQEEAAILLGSPSWSSELLGGMASSALETAAEAFLRATDDLARDVRREAVKAERPGAGTFTGAVLEAVARDAPEGFPARLTPRTLLGMFGAPEEVVRGLKLELTLPAVVGASSFARALESFGAAFRRAAALSSGAPFAVASDPCFLDAHRFGNVFGALAMDPVFHRRGLGVAARVASQQARVLAKTALLHARTLALQALLGAPSGKLDAGRFEALTHRVYGQALPGQLLGAFPALRHDSDPRLAALLTSLPFARDVRERFDEDWFRNPHAWRALRGRASGPARPPAEPIDAGSLARAFEEALA